MGNGAYVPVTNVGSFSLLFGHKILQLKNVLHVPYICKKILSITQFAKHNKVFFEIHPFHYFVKDLQTGVILLMVHIHKGLYRFPTSSCHSLGAASSIQVSTQRQSVNHDQLKASTVIDLWHNILGHPYNKVPTKCYRVVRFL